MLLYDFIYMSLIISVSLITRIKMVVFPIKDPRFRTKAIELRCYCCFFVTNSQVCAWNCPVCWIKSKIYAIFVVKLSLPSQSTVTVTCVFLAEIGKNCFHVWRCKYVGFKVPKPDFFLNYSTITELSCGVKLNLKFNVAG